MAERRAPTPAEVESYLRDRRNWGRWGKDDQVGAVNLITPQKRAQAASLARSGRAVSLSRDFPKTPAPNNPNPAQHFMRTSARPGGSGAAVDYYGIVYHGLAATHIDALCHVWDDHGMWNGRDPKEETTFEGARFGDINQWPTGIVTRGVLLDVPRHRQEPYVTQERPIHGWELEEIARAEGVSLEPGDAVVVYSGYRAWEEANPDWVGPCKARPAYLMSALYPR